MTKISQKELMSINDVVARHQIIAAKLNDYSNECSDPEVKKMFKEAAFTAGQSVQNLINLL